MSVLKEIQNNKTRKFTGLDFYNLNPGNKYSLLPFRFHRISQKKEILVNEIGDFLIVPSGIAEKIITKTFFKSDNEELYGDLIANFFITEEPVPALLKKNAQCP